MTTSKICLECGAEITAGTECPDHPGFPLLDPNDPAVRDELINQEQRHKDRRLQRHALVAFASAASGVLAVLIAIGLFTGAPFWFVAAPLIALAAAGGAAKLAREHARRTWRPRYGRWTAERTYDFSLQELQSVEPTGFDSRVENWIDAGFTTARSFA